MKKLRNVVLGLTAAVLLAGCGTPMVKQSDVEKQVSAQLAAKVGRTPDKVSCPDDLEGKTGTKITCTLTDQGTSYPVTVTVKSVSGSTVHFYAEVGKANGG